MKVINLTVFTVFTLFSFPSNCSGRAFICFSVIFRFLVSKETPFAINSYATSSSIFSYGSIAAKKGSYISAVSSSRLVLLLSLKKLVLGTPLIRHIDMKI